MAIERIEPGTLEWEAYYANHISRYKFATIKLAGQNIVRLLDAACGVGYGAAFLSQEMPGTTVIAVDRSTEALAIAGKNFSVDNVKFLEDDCHSLEAARKYGPFEAVVSYETLEHLPEPAKFLANCNQMLCEGGQLIVSTPNQLVSSPDGLTWEFHEKEYHPHEFVTVLKNAGFSDVQIFGQRLTAIGTLRQQLRGELYRLHSNPFSRFGKWVQQVFRKAKFGAILPEQPEDIEIVAYPDLGKIYDENRSGPFVLIAICKK